MGRLSPFGREKHTNMLVVGMGLRGEFGGGKGKKGRSEHGFSGIVVDPFFENFRVKGEIVRVRSGLSPTFHPTKLKEYPQQSHCCKSAFQFCKRKLSSCPTSPPPRRPRGFPENEEAERNKLTLRKSGKKGG